MKFQKREFAAGIMGVSQGRLATTRAGSRRWIFTVCLLLAGIAIVTVAKPDKADYVKLSKPEALKFGELVQLEQTVEPDAKLAGRLDKLLHTPLPIWEVRNRIALLPTLWARSFARRCGTLSAAFTSMESRSL
jgi:hypothetical protein